MTAIKTAEAKPMSNAEPQFATDRRAWVRYTCKRELQTQSDLPATVIFRKATLCNVSRSGVGIILAGPVPIGTIFKVGLEGWTGSRLVLARVVYVHPQDDGWVHGCELARILSEAEVQEFLD